MNKITVFFAAAMVALLSGCASTTQFVELPDQSVALANRNKARIYVARPTTFGAAVSMKVSDGDTLIGKTGPKGYLCWERDPGMMELKGKAENTDIEKVDVKKGYIYYFQQSVRMGFLMARNDIKQLDGEEGQKAVGKCKAPQL